MMKPKFGRKAELVTFLPFWEAIFIIVGTVIGAGILGLPSVFAKNGYLTATAALLVSLVLVIELAFMIVELEGSSSRQIPSLIGYYLGGMARAVAFLGFLIAVFSALTAYYIGLADSFRSLGLPPGLGYLTGIIMSFYVCYRGLKGAARAELIITIVMIGLIFLIILFSSTNVNVEKLNEFHLPNLASPFGIIIFALYGHMILPEVKRLLISAGLRKKISLAIILGYSIPAMIYLLFSASIVGSLESIPDVATLAFHGYLYVLGISFALLALSTSLMGNALVVRDTLWEDFRIKEEGILIAPFIPLMLATLGGKNFVTMLDIGGIFGICLISIMIALSYLRGGRKIYRKISATACILIFLYLILRKIYLMI